MLTRDQHLEFLTANSGLIAGVVEKVKGQVGVVIVLDDSPQKVRLGFMPVENCRKVWRGETLAEVERHLKTYGHPSMVTVVFTSPANNIDIYTVMLVH
jgi:hypothetical protein